LLGDLEQRGLLKLVDGRWQLTIAAEDVAAYHPDTVTRLIDSQIDRLEPDDQRVLEAASIAGMVFASAVVAFALGLDPDRVDAICERLASTRHFLSVMGTEKWPDGTIQYCYAFTHAMVQNAALARNPSGTIRLLHRRIGERLETAYGAESESIAAELAFHFDEGHQWLKAVQYYVASGERGVQRIGASGALRQFERAREIVSWLPAGPERDSLELRTLRNLAGSHRRDEVRMMQRSQTPDELASSAEKAREEARRLNDPALLAETAVRSAHLAYNAGELVRAATLFDELLSAGEGEGSRGEAARMGGSDDPLIHACWLRGIISWLLGYPDDAIFRVRHSVSLAQATAQPYPTLVTVSALTLFQMLVRNPKGTLENVERMRALMEAKGIVAPDVHNQLMRSWAMAVLDPKTSRSLADQLRPPETSAKVFYALPVIEVCSLAGQIERALQHVSEALAEAEKTGERVWIPEILRLRGELLHSTDREEAERSLGEAIELARSQSSKSLELRAAMSLCRLRRGKSRARTLGEVRRLHDSFTEGFETRDLLDAKAMLEGKRRARTSTH
jgi:tetratricopeptide (TPR) repeat protein